MSISYLHASNMSARWNQGTHINRNHDNLVNIIFHHLIFQFGKLIYEQGLPAPYLFFGDIPKIVSLQMNIKENAKFYEDILLWVMAYFIFRTEIFSHNSSFTICNYNK